MARPKLSEPSCAGVHGREHVPILCVFARPPGRWAAASPQSPHGCLGGGFCCPSGAHRLSLFYLILSLLGCVEANRNDPPSLRSALLMLYLQAGLAAKPPPHRWCQSANAGLAGPQHQAHTPWVRQDVTTPQQQTHPNSLTTWDRAWAVSLHTAETVGIHLHGQGPRAGPGTPAACALPTPARRQDLGSVTNTCNLAPRPGCSRLMLTPTGHAIRLGLREAAGLTSAFPT